MHLGGRQSLKKTRPDILAITFKERAIDNPLKQIPSQPDRHRHRKRAGIPANSFIKMPLPILPEI
jgi:hypothetical protein